MPCTPAMGVGGALSRIREPRRYFDPPDRSSACAVALKPPPQLAHPQNDLIWTVADVTELDLATAHIGGYLRTGC